MYGYSDFLVGTYSDGALQPYIARNQHILWIASPCICSHCAMHIIHMCQNISESLLAIKSKVRPGNPNFFLLIVVYPVRQQEPIKIEGFCLRSLNHH